MDNEEPQVVKEGEMTILQPNELTTKQTESDEGPTYSKELLSQVDTAFLPYASQLESVEQTKILRKRKGKNTRKKPLKVTNIPGYKNKDKKGTTL